MYRLVDSERPLVSWIAGRMSGRGKPGHGEESKWQFQRNHYNRKVQDKPSDVVGVLCFYFSRACLTVEVFRPCVNVPTAPGIP